MSPAANIPGIPVPSINGDWRCSITYFLGDKSKFHINYFVEWKDLSSYSKPLLCIQIDLELQKSGIKR
jgi:hypothetical protein